jgi:hypothetical protein
MRGMPDPMGHDFGLKTRDPGTILDLTPGGRAGDRVFGAAILASGTMASSDAWRGVYHGPSPWLLTHLAAL